MRDPRRDIVLTLILEWDPLESRIHDHLGLTLAQWMRFRVDGRLPEDYEPREPAGPVEPVPPNAKGRPSGKTRQFSDEERDEVVKLRTEGGSLRSIARKLSTHQNVIERLLREAQG